MSDAGGTNVATFYITGNASGVSNAVNQANNSLATLEKAAAQNWWGIRNLGIAFAALPAAVGAGTAAAIHSATQWEDAMAGVARTNFDASKSLEENNANMGKLSDQLFQIARNIPQSALTLAGIAESAGALGVAQQDVAAFTETVANLAAVTNLSADQAAVDLARISGLLGITSAGYDNLASSITGTGVATAATESDITAIGTRLAGVAGVVGLTADQVVGISAAVRSAGVSAQEGGTQIQKTFIDIARAVANGGDELTAFAGLAGLSEEAFREAFSQDAAQLLVTIAQHMDDMNDSGGGVIEMLDAAGVKEQRQVRTLLLLAQAQGNTTNESIRLSHILGVAADTFQNTTNYAEALRRRYNTLAGQTQILKNLVFEGSTAFGTAFLPAIKAVVSVFDGLITGFIAAPGPLKAVLGILLGLTAVISGLGAVALLVGPRILIALGAFRNLQTEFLKSAASSAAATSGLNNVGGAALRLIVTNEALVRSMTAQQRAALSAAIANGELALSEKILASVGSSVAAAGLGTASSMATASAWAIRLGKASVWLMAIITALGVVMAFLGNTSQKAAQEQARLVQPQAKLVDALRNQKKGAADAGDQWIRNQKIYREAFKTADALKIKHEELFQLIKGGGNAVDAEATINKLTKAHKNGNKAAGEALHIINLLQQQYQNSASEAGVLGRNTDSLGTDLADMGEDAATARKELQKLHDTMEGLAQAHIDLIGALMQQAVAEVNLTEAENALREAEYQAANVADRLASAERDVIEARLDQTRAANDLIDAERNLATAREDAQNAVLDLEDKLADANDSYLDSLDKIHEDELAIEKLRAGSSLKEILKLTNDLRQAQLNLAKSTQAEQDAEWQLQFLREEGASNRDIADAEMALEQAKLDVVDATEAQSDAQDKLAEASDPIKQANDLAAAERQLASDRRDAEGALREIASLENDLANARQDLASNRAYIEAQDDLARAHAAVDDAAQATKDAEHALDEERRTNQSALDLAKSTQAYEQSLYDLATANTEVKKQTALMNGETWDAGRNAHTLAEELGHVIDNVPDSAVTERLRNFMQTLSTAPDVPAIPDDFGDDIRNDISDAIGTDPLEYDAPLAPPKIPDDAKKGFKAKAEDVIKFALIGIGALIVGTIVTGLLAFLGVPAALATVLALLASAIAGFLIEKFLESGIGKAIVDGIKKGFEDAADFAKWIWHWFQDHVLDPVLRLFGIKSPSEVFAEIGRDLIAGLLGGIAGTASNVAQAIGGFIGNIIGMFGGAGSWLIGKGAELVGGLWNGIAGFAGSFFGAVGGFIGNIIGMFGGAAGWLVSQGAAILIGLWNGLAGWAGSLFQHVSGVIQSLFGMFGKAGEWLLNAGKNLLIGLWNGMADKSGWLFDQIGKLAGDVIHAFTHPWELLSPSKVFHRMGENLMLGLGNGIEAESKKLLPVLGDVASSVTDEMVKHLDLSAKQFGPFGVSDLAHNRDLMALSGGAASSAALGAVTNYYHDEVNIEAHTDADPDDIVNTYLWAKRVRLRR